MGLDVAVPDPPDLTEGFAEGYEFDVSRRADLQQYLESENAWGEAFSEWVSVTTLTEQEYAVIDDLALISEFDFFWDADANHVAYEAPSVRSHPDARNRHPELDSSARIASIDNALDELGEIVADVLTEYYVEWESEDVFAERYDAEQEPQ